MGEEVWWLDEALVNKDDSRGETLKHRSTMNGVSAALFRSSQLLHSKYYLSPIFLLLRGVG